MVTVMVMVMVGMDQVRGRVGSRGGEGGRGGGLS